MVSLMTFGVRYVFAVYLSWEMFSSMHVLYPVVSIQVGTVKLSPDIVRIP